MVEEYLAGVVDELREVMMDRFSDENRLPHVFDGSVRLCVDTFPIEIQRPKDARWQAATFHGKYKKHVLKV